MSLKKLSDSSGNSDPIATVTGTGKANAHRLSLEDAAMKLQRAVRVALRSGPYQPLVDRCECCGAARRTCHSLQARNLNEVELTDRGQSTISLRLRQ